MPLVPALPEDALVGRDDTLAEVAALLKLGHRVITLLGPPGIGKTALATRVAAATPDAVVCALEHARTGDEVLLAVASALAVPMSGVDSAGRALAARGPVLVVLDHAGQVCDAVAELLGAWRRSAPAARFLVTSRMRLRVGDERCLELPPLDESAALGLFVRRAEARRPGFADTSGELEGAAEVVRLLDGVPLALELAAARMQASSARDLARLLRAWADQRMRPERQHGLHAALTSSWEALPDADRTALARLAVFRGGFDTGAAEAVLGRVDAVERLLDQAWIIARGRRFALPPAVRAFASERLGPEETARTRDRHARHFRELGRQLLAEADGPDQAEVLDRLHAERHNLHAAFRHLLPRAPGAAGQVVSSMAPAWEARGAPAVELRLLEEAAAAVTDVPTARADLLAALALELGRQGRWHAADARAAEAFSLLRDGAAEETVARCRLARGQVRAALDDLDAALDDLSAVAASTLPRWRVRGLEAMAVAHRGRGGDAMRWVDRAREVARSHGLQPISLEVTAGGVLLDLARLDDALATLRDALDRMGSRRPRQAAAGWILLGRVHEARGDQDAAHEAWERAMAISPGRDVALECRGRLALLQWWTGARGDALEEILSAWEDGAVDPAVAARVHAWAGFLLADVGRLGEAVARFEQAGRLQAGRYTEESAVIEVLARRVYAARDGAALSEVRDALGAIRPGRADVRLAVRLVRRALGA